MGVRLIPMSNQRIRINDLEIGIDRVINITPQFIRNTLEKRYA